MLSELRIRNFALIDELAIRLGPGLNVLSGETGAGKSIIVGALSLLLGERASGEVVRVGADRATIEGVFDLGGRDDLLPWLDERGIEMDEGLLVLKREVVREGRNRAWINGSPATASLVRELGSALVSLHGQHEHQDLLHRDEQRAILDAYAGNGDLVERVATAHATLMDVRRRIDERERHRRDVEARADFLRFQADEIDAAALHPGEDEALDVEQRRLSHAEELMGLARVIGEALTSDEALVSRVGGLRREIEKLIRIDGSQAEAGELLDTAYYALEELGERMSRYAESIEHDPGRLDEIRRRQDLLYRLKTKYGPTIEDVIETGRAAREELEAVSDAGGELSRLQAREREAAVAFDALVAELGSRRADATSRIAAEVDEILPELGMDGGRFQAVSLPLAAPGPAGGEEIEFRIALNKGFAPQPISLVASGGELSRVMLALKAILARLNAVPTLVFDEVDAGIGGRIALRVGEKLRQVAGDHQVFAVTHLPQIASSAHIHLLVTKNERNGTTTTDVETLGSGSRVTEIARMLGGDPESDVSLEHARELLRRAVAD